MKKQVINKKYNWFAIHIATNKIVDGWDYPADYTSQDVKVFYKNDMKDNDRKTSEHILANTKLATKLVGNPYDSDNWLKDNI